MITNNGSQVLLTAGLIRQRAATADALRSGYLRLALGVGTSTLPPVMPTFVQDDGRFRFSTELFIVFRLARSREMPLAPPIDSWSNDRGRRPST